MTPTVPNTGAREPHSLREGARRISLAHLAKLRRIVAHAGTLHAAVPFLRASPDTIADALTSKVFRRQSAEALEAKIDGVDLASWRGRESETAVNRPR